MTEPIKSPSADPAKFGPLTPQQLLWGMQGALVLLAVTTFLPWAKIVTDAGPLGTMSESASLFDISKLLGILVILFSVATAVAPFVAAKIPHAPLAIVLGAANVFQLVLISASVAHPQSEGDMEMVHAGWGIGAWLGMLLAIIAVVVAVLLNLPALKALCCKSSGASV